MPIEVVLPPRDWSLLTPTAYENARLINVDAANRGATMHVLRPLLQASILVQLITLHSTAELLRSAAPWDDLWLRSETALPTLRDEQVALWLDSFSPGLRFCALVVEDAGRYVAALPLVERRRMRVLKTGSLPTNLWSASGDLLLDPQADVARATDLLAEGFRGLPWPLCWFDLVPLGMPRWQALLAALERRGLATSAQPLYTIAQIEIEKDWTTYEASRSRNHRQQMRKLARRIEREGETRLVRYANCEPNRLEALLRRGFEIEDRSWKGSEGTSVLRTPGGFEFYLRQAELLNSRGELQLVFLEHAGQPIAFEYGWLAKQTYFSPKVGYDAAFASFRPGQMLRMKLYEQFHAEHDCRLVDFLGPISDATARWSNRRYEISRLLIAGASKPSRCAVRLASSLDAARRSVVDRKPASEQVEERIAERASI